jgi:hypothetical protein
LAGGRGAVVVGGGGPMWSARSGRRGGRRWWPHGRHVGAGGWRTGAVPVDDGRATDRTEGTDGVGCFPAWSFDCD